jgi:hypothetical protein
LCEISVNSAKRDLAKRIELINWVLENMKDPDTNICALIETKMNNIIDKINEKDSIIEADPLDLELRILDWILYVVCGNE